jgi:hypothetical protein
MGQHERINNGSVNDRGAKTMDKADKGKTTLTEGMKAAAAPVDSLVMADPCRCNCGYTCGGPGRCDLFAADPLRCVEEHYRRDCDHDFTGPWVTLGNGGSVTCAKCGIDACSHDCMVGP